MKYIVFSPETKIEGMTMLTRVTLAIDCEYGKSGDKGGWVEKPQNVIGDTWIGDEAVLSGEATLSGSAVIKDKAKVSGSASITGKAIISGNAVVFGKATVRENAQVMGNCVIKDQADVLGNVILKDDCLMWGKSRVHTGTWIESPFQAQGPVHFVTESQPGYLYIGCIEKSFLGWITGGYKIAKKYNAESNNQYVHYEAMIQPIIEKYVKYSLDNWDDLSLIQKATYKIVEVAGHKYLKGKDGDRYTRED
jgi:carbonic anhydrase/acetyltransferase-like protein (isoleucine patch superfamily)|tara:strand:+ start:2981 stop:3730 length:750 start_codon:yes stop_codon:yes gene_type:complete